MRTLHVAPLSVAGLLASRLFGQSTVVLTSATLVLGGSFDALARQWGLPAAGSETTPKELPPDDGGGHGNDPATNLVWHGLDVGSPFAHAKAGILYVARHLPPPGRDGLAPAVLDEIDALVRAAGGRALGLFSSMRAAKQAAEDLRGRWDGTCSARARTRQHPRAEVRRRDRQRAVRDDLAVAGRRRARRVAAAGDDRPHPVPAARRPLVAARQRAVDARGGNGFLTVSATHAALLLAQGAGRLLRGTGDRGVVAILDSRVATKQYGAFIRGSLPPFWSTQDPAVVRGALERLRDAD